MSLNIEFFIGTETGLISVFAQSDFEGTDFCGTLIERPTGFVFVWGFGMQTRYTPAQEQEIETAADNKAAVLYAIKRLTT